MPTVAVNDTSLLKAAERLRDALSESATWQALLNAKDGVTVINATQSKTHIHYCELDPTLGSGLAVDPYGIVGFWGADAEGLRDGQQSLITDEAIGVEITLVPTESAIDDKWIEAANNAGAIQNEILVALRAQSQQLAWGGLRRTRFGRVDPDSNGGVEVFLVRWEIPGSRLD